jgi:hypothetical protein
MRDRLYAYGRERGRWVPNSKAIILPHHLDAIALRERDVHLPWIPGHRKKGKEEEEEIEVRSKCVA